MGILIKSSEALLAKPVTAKIIRSCIKDDGVTHRVTISAHYIDGHIITLDVYDMQDNFIAQAPITFKGWQWWEFTWGETLQCDVKYKIVCDGTVIVEKHSNCRKCRK
jgi:hypothetical protein